MPGLYPAFLDLTDRDVLVVGGGAVAARKIGPLLASGARLTVVAAHLCEEIEGKAGEGTLSVCRRDYRASDLDGMWLAVAATDDAEVNAAVSADAARARVLCNVVDQPELCSFQAPAVCRRGLLQIAVSTGGASPALAKRIRIELEQTYGESYARLLEALRDLRRHYQRRYPDDQARRQRLLEAFLDSEAPDKLLRDGDPEAFYVELKKWQSR